MVGTNPNGNTKEEDSGNLLNRWYLVLLNCLKSKWYQ